jgi:excisionase family DNA binding protein
MQSLLLTIAGTARALAVSERTVQRLISTGALPSVRIGDARRVARTDLERYIDERRDLKPEPDAESEPERDLDARRVRRRRRMPTARGAEITAGCIWSVVRT